MDSVICLGSVHFTVEKPTDNKISRCLISKRGTFILFFESRRNRSIQDSGTNVIMSAFHVGQTTDESPRPPRFVARCRLQPSFRQWRKEAEALSELKPVAEFFPEATRQRHLLCDPRQCRIYGCLRPPASDASLRVVHGRSFRLTTARHRGTSRILRRQGPAPHQSGMGFVENSTKEEPGARVFQV